MNRHDGQNSYLDDTGFLAAGLHSAAALETAFREEGEVDVRPISNCIEY